MEMTKFKKALGSVIMGSVILSSNISNAATVVDVVSRFGVTSTNGLLASEFIKMLNEEQKEYEFRLKTIPGAQGEAADQRLLALAKEGQKVLWYGPISTFTVNRYTVGNTYDRDRDIVPLQSIFGVPFSIMVNAESPINTVDELMEKLKTKGGFFATSVGAGINDVINDIILNQRGVSNIKSLKYATPFDIKRAVLVGEADYAMHPHPDMAGLKMLAVSSKTRLSDHPDIPTGTELGISAFNYTSLNMISVPKEFAEFGNSIVPLLHKVCTSPKMKALTSTAGYQNFCLDSNEITSQIASEVKYVDSYKHIFK